MAKKVKKAAVATGGQLLTMIRESAAQIWLAGLGAFSKAQQEGTEMFNALVKEGEAVQKRTKKAAGDTVAAFRDNATGAWGTLVKEGEAVQKRTKKAAGDTVAAFRDNATGAWDKLEHVFEQRVSRALHNLNVPTKKDIDHLSRRVAELTSVADKLSTKMGHEKRH